MSNARNNKGGSGLFYNDDEFQDVDILPQDVTPYTSMSYISHAPQNGVRVIEDTSHIDAYNKTVEKVSSTLYRIEQIIEGINDKDIQYYPTDFSVFFNSSLNNYYRNSEEFIKLQRKAVGTDIITLAIITKQLNELNLKILSQLNALKLEYNKYILNTQAKCGSQESQGGSVSFFRGCSTLEDLNKRYRNLTKAFHPDLDAGDEETMKQINAEYGRLKKELSSNR